MAAFELSLNGYFWEPPILLRNALEGFTSAWDIIHNPKRFEIWKDNKKFKSTDSISNAKEINQIIGHLYGLPSNMYTHIKQKNASPSIVIVEEKLKLQFFGLIRNGKESIREGEIYLCLIVTYMCLQMAEISFFKYSNELETIEVIPGKQFVKSKVTDRHKRFVDKSLMIFKDLADNPKGKF